MHSSSGSESPVWIARREPLPNTCVTCGMFTDHLVSVKYIQLMQQTVLETKKDDTAVALGCFLHLLGPIGWILAAVLSNSGGGGTTSTTEQTTKSKGKIKVPCCRLCSGQQMPEAVEGSVAEGRYLFLVHPRFEERLLALRRDAMDSQ